MHNIPSSNSIENIQIDVPLEVSSQVEAALDVIESSTAYPPTMNELYVFALRRGVANLLEEYRDSVIGGYAKVQQRHLPISTLSNLGR